MSFKMGDAPLAPKDPDVFEEELRTRPDRDYVRGPNGGYYRPTVKNGVVGCWRHWAWSRQAEFIVGFNSQRFNSMDEVIRWAKADGRHEPGGPGTPLSKRVMIG